ncbi:MAG: putative Signal transduction histidine kinase [Chloroflexi bacterium]|nr:putative Signal transduction histidine kinase [Chloroflexota bacterium]
MSEDPGTGPNRVSSRRRIGTARTPGARADTQRTLEELSFLHDVAQLASEARDWDELMRTVVDRTTEALHVEVCSFYLLDPASGRLVLAATNGLDRDQVGRISLAVGEGVTGAAAAERRPIEVPDVRLDKRFMFLGGFDRAGLTSMLSVPLTWNDRVVGVLNIQSVETRRFAPGEISFLSTIAALLGGIVEKGRLGREQEAQLEALTALDAARAELLSVVTHELRTPLSVVRAYVDLLADAAAGIGEVPARASAEDWRNAAVDQITRLDRLVDSILVSVRGEGLGDLPRLPFDAGQAVAETVELLRPLLRNHRLRFEPPAGRTLAVGDEARFRQVIEQLLENEAKYAPRGWGVSVGTWHQAGEVRTYVTDDGPGIPFEEWESVFVPFVRAARRRGRGSGIGLYAARRLMEAMGGRIWVEGNGYGGSRFVVAVPVAPER